MVFNNLNGETIKADRTVIPEGCLSFSEQALYIAEASENEFNKLFESVGIEELAVFESTGSEVIYEGAKLDEFKKKAVQLFKDLWGKIKRGYEMIVDKFNEVTAGAKKNFPKLSNRDLERIKLEDSAKMGKVHEYDFGGATPRENAHKLIMEINADFKSGKEDEDRASLRDKYDDKIVSQISGTDKTSIKEAKDALKKKYIGNEKDVDFAWAKKNFDYINMYTFEAPRKEIKASFNDEKTIIEGVIDEVKKFKETDVNYAKTTISLMRDVCNTLHQCMAVQMDALKHRHSECRNIYTKLYVASQKAVKESASVQNESTIIATQQDLVDKSFDW